MLYPAELSEFELSCCEIQNPLQSSIDVMCADACCVSAMLCVLQHGVEARCRALMAAVEDVMRFLAGKGRGGCLSLCPVLHIDAERKGATMRM
jgi:hypothetical protein